MNFVTESFSMCLVVGPTTGDYVSNRFVVNRCEPYPLYLQGEVPFLVSSTGFSVVFRESYLLTYLLVGMGLSSRET